MLFLRIKRERGYGKTHCEGVSINYENYLLNQNITIEQLEEIINEKLESKEDSFTIEILI